MTGGDHPEDADLEDRFDHLETRLNDLLTEREAWRDNVVRPRLDELETARDDAHAERAELATTVDVLQDTIAELRRELDALSGLADGEHSTPAKRAADLRQSLIRQARGQPDDVPVKKMHYEDVEDTLLSLGHGPTLHNQQLFDAMDEASATSGFWIEEEAKQTSEGNLARAVCVDLRELPRVTGQDASNEIITSKTGPAVTDGGEGGESR